MRSLPSVLLISQERNISWRHQLFQFLRFALKFQTLLTFPCFALNIPETYKDRIISWIFYKNAAWFFIFRFFWTSKHYTIAANLNQLFQIKQDLLRRVFCNGTWVDLRGRGGGCELNAIVSTKQTYINLSIIVLWYLVYVYVSKFCNYSTIDISKLLTIRPYEKDIQFT